MDRRSTLTWMMCVVRGFDRTPTKQAARGATIQSVLALLTGRVVVPVNIETFTGVTLHHSCYIATSQKLADLRLQLESQPKYRCGILRLFVRMHEGSRPFGLRELGDRVKPSRVLTRMPHHTKLLAIFVPVKPPDVFLGAYQFCKHQPSRVKAFVKWLRQHLPVTLRHRRFHRTSELFIPRSEALRIAELRSRGRKIVDVPWLMHHFSTGMHGGGDFWITPDSRPEALHNPRSRRLFLAVQRNDVLHDSISVVWLDGTETALPRGVLRCMYYDVPAQ